MPRYDTRVQPPAPFVDVLILHPSDHEQTRHIQGKLDSGADISVIPKELADELRLIPAREIQTRGYDGTVRDIQSYFVALEVEGYPIQLVEVVASHRADVLLGRDVLNHFRITLDGKTLAFEMTDP
jgi:predicted aspartyl protease